MGNRFRRLIQNRSLILILILTGTAACSHETIQEQSRNTASSQQMRKIAGAHLIWPIAKRKVTQEFKPGFHGTPHDGIDISAPKGTRIYAPADGIVTYAGQKFHGYGKMIIIEHSKRLATIYGHCDKLLVKEGDHVHRGNLIALVGRTGKATAPHLHFEVRLDREPVNPMAFLP